MIFSRASPIRLIDRCRDIDEDQNRGRSVTGVAAFTAQGSTSARTVPAQAPCAPGSGGDAYRNFRAPGDWHSGGDNNGRFSNTPSCNGAHGSPF
jgi:hypothetical protein